MKSDLHLLRKESNEEVTVYWEAEGSVMLQYSYMIREPSTHTSITEWMFASSSAIASSKITIYILNIYQIAASNES